MPNDIKVYEIEGGKVVALDASEDDVVGTLCEKDGCVVKDESVASKELFLMPGAKLSLSSDDKGSILFEGRANDEVIKGSDGGGLLASNVLERDLESGGSRRFWRITPKDAGSSFCYVVVPTLSERECKTLSATNGSCGDSKE